MLLRLRRYGRRLVLTYKGPPQAARHKVREELEVLVSDLDAAALILSRLGLVASFRYEKYRTEFRGPGGGAVLLDETPIGDFLELEGAPSWIDRTAARLGFGEADYITSSYGTLYVESCRGRGIVPGDMVFR